MNKKIVKGSKKYFFFDLKYKKMSLISSMFLTESNHVSITLLYYLENLDNLEKLTKRFKSYINLYDLFFI